MRELGMEEIALWMPVRPEPSEVSPLPMLAWVFGVGVGCGLAWPSAASGVWLDVVGWVGLAGLVWGWVKRSRGGLAAVRLLAVVGVGLVGWGVGGAEGARYQARHWEDGEGAVVVEVDGDVRQGIEGRRGVRVQVIGHARRDAGGEWRVEEGEITGARLWWEVPTEEGPLGEGVRRIGQMRWWRPQWLASPGQRREEARLMGLGVEGMLRAQGPVMAMHGEGRSAWGWLSERRQEVGGALREITGGGGVVEAITLGEGGGVDPQVRTTFGVAGLAHVLAVSGLHFGVVAWAVWWAVGGVLRRWGWGVRRWGVEVMAAVVSGPALGVYVVFVGAPVSARRAFVMVTCVLLGRALRREGHGVIGLAVAALVILGWEPQALHQLGFQLSFAAVLGIFWGVQAWDKPLRGLIERRCQGWRAKALGWVASMAVVTAAASVATTPLVLWHFGQSPWVGLVANAWVVPWVSFVVLPVGLAGVLVWWLWPSGGVALMKVARLAERAMVWSVEGFVEYAPWVNVEAPALPGWLLCLIGALAVAALRVGVKPWAKRALGPLAVAVAVGLMAVTWGGGAARDAGALTVTFLSVGQGDATLIEAPSGEAWLIDAGGARRWDPGAKVVVPALYAMGRRGLDHVVVTHPDLDHFGGMAAVIRAMRPHTVWTCGVDDPSPQYQDMLAAAGEVGAQVRPLTGAHPEVSLGGDATLRVLWPDRPDPSRGKNDNSVVIRLTHGEVSFLLPGDLEAAGEEALLRAEWPLAATVLKAGHHGSQTSSTGAFLDAVKPQAVVYSVGADNTFGLPHPDVVERYRARGVVGYRTDRDGSIQMTSDGETIKVTTWSP